MSFEIRDYQEKHTNEIIRLLGKHRIVCAQLPTGGGKTVEFTKLAYRFWHKTDTSVIILVHREELMRQTKATIEKMYGVKVSVITAGTRWVDFCPIYVGMVESVYRRLEHLPEDIGLVIIDEAHNAAFNKTLRSFTSQYVIGFTATPKSSSKKEPMNKYYGDIAVGPQIAELIKLGNLCQNITRSPKDVVDRAKLVMASTGDFDIGSMASEYLKTRYVMSTVSSYNKFGKNKKAIVYNVNIAHSIQVAECFNFCGFPAKHVDGETPDIQRAEIFKWFKETPGAILCNVGVATMGFDEPTIEIVIINRSTASMPLWLQMCGRGSRPIDDTWIDLYSKEYPYPVEPKTTFTIIDMGGNAINHGDWSDERDWKYIFHNPELPGNGVAPVKECPQCNGIVHAATIYCKLINEDGEECGYIFERKKYEELKVIGDFIVVTKDIDIEGLIERNKLKKNYFPFFEIGRKIIDNMYATGKEITTEQVNLIFKGYLGLIEKWFVKEFPEKYYDKYWHEEFARQYFFKTLKKRFIKVKDEVYA